MAQRIHVLVHRGPESSREQLVRVPKEQKDSAKALTMLVMACAKKLKIKMSKAKAKKAKLHRMNPGARESSVVESVSSLVKGERLRLCSAEESSALLASMKKNRPHSIARLPLPELPEQMWELIAVRYCAQQRVRAEPWIQARLRALRGANSSGCTEEVFRSWLSRPANRDVESGGDHDKQEPIESGPSVPAVPCREAFVLSCLNRRWHRIIGNSSDFDLLGSWFFNVEGDWVPYSAQASWDLEVARLLGKTTVTVQVCEPRQDISGRPRRRHVMVDLQQGLQMKAGKRSGKGRVFRVKRLPADVLGR